jgi:hypothetical protein
MRDFPTSAEEFYKLRDDRTNRCSVDRKYQSTECVVYLSPAASSTGTAQTMLLVSANLLSRWCRKVTIVMLPVEMHAALGVGRADLGSFVLAQMQDADPFGAFQVTTDRDAAATAALYIGYGTEEMPGAHGIFIDASGWLAGISTRPIELPSSGDCNYLGAIAAGCLGVAQLFKLAIGMPPENYFRDGIFDVYQLAWVQGVTQAPWPDNLNIGNVLMVGAGSVGSSAVYCMHLSGLAGNLTVVDGDIVKVENFNRSPIFGRQTYEMSKSKAVAGFLSGSALNATAEPLWWNEFFAKRGRTTFEFDIWLPLANEFGVRRQMQHNVPPLMIHASTTANWGVNHGRHIPGRDDCLSDRFIDEVSADGLTCASGPVETPEAVIDSALPFASLFAGLLITADLIRAQLAGYPQVPNFALFDWHGPLDMIQIWDRKPREGCICREQGASFHNRFNGRTKYRHVFGFS